MTAVVLWDVDGTLVRTAGAGAAAFFDAFEEVLGVRLPHDAVPMAGKTDPQISVELLDLIGFPEDQRARVLPDLLAALEKCLAALAGSIAREGWVPPGVAEVVAGLAGSGRVVQTLVTGNLAANARVKLGALGLGGGIDFDVGAYGSDDGDRCRLVPIALARLEQRGIAVEPSRVWVVGDTPRDLECARAGGVRCLLVATGSYNIEDLGQAGADAVLADLSDVPAVIELLGAH